MPEHLHIETFCLGQWQTNCYVVHRGRQCWIVDAGFDPEPMLDFIRQHKLEPTQVVLTHAHLDHIAGLHAVRGAFPAVPILIHDSERCFLTDPSLNLSGFLDSSIIAPEATDVLTHGQQLDLDGIAFEVRHTPGHSPGGITLYQPLAGVAIVGDTLFAGGIGRYDFPTSDGRQLLAGIRQQLLTMPEATRVLPGHGPATTIGREKQTNPYLQ